MKNPNNKCIICGNETELRDKYHGYKKTCSTECLNEQRSQQAKKNRVMRQLSGRGSWTNSY